MEKTIHQEIREEAIKHWAQEYQDSDISYVDGKILKILDLPEDSEESTGVIYRMFDPENQRKLRSKLTKQAREWIINSLECHTTDNEPKVDWNDPKSALLYLKWQLAADEARKTQLNVKNLSNAELLESVRTNFLSGGNIAI